MRKPLKRVVHSNAGIALVSVLFVLVLVAGMGVILIPLANNSMTMSSADQQDKSAFYIAEAGLHVKMEEIEQHIAQVYKDSSDENNFYKNVTNKMIVSQERYDDFEKMNGEEPFVMIDVNQDTKNTYKIVSKGYLGKQSRTVSKTVDIYWQDKYEEVNKTYTLPDVAVFATDRIRMKNNAVIDGNVGLLKPTDRHIQKNKNAKIKGEIVEKERGEFPELPKFPHFPDNLVRTPSISVSKKREETYLLRESQSMETIEIEKGSTLTIDVGLSDKKIVVDQMKIQGKGRLNVKGEGKLFIYVKDELKLNNKSVLNTPGKASDLHIFYSGKRSFNLPNNTEINGSLYVESSDITIRNNANIYGNIFTGGKNIILNNNSVSSSQLILAPQADVLVENNARINGVVFSKNMDIKNNAVIEYDTSFVLDGPISLEALEYRHDESSLVETGASPIVESGPVYEEETN